MGGRENGANRPQKRILLWMALAAHRTLRLYVNELRAREIQSAVEFEAKLLALVRDPFSIWMKEQKQENDCSMLAGQC